MLFQLIQATKSGNVYNLHDFYTFNSEGVLTSSFKTDVTKQFEYNFSTKEYAGTPKIILRNDLFTPALNYRQHTHIICFDLRKIYEIVGYNYTSDFQTEMLLAEDFFISKYYELQNKKIFNKNTFDVNRFIGVHNVDEISNKYDTITEQAVKQDTVGKWLLIFIQGDYSGNVTLNLNAPPLSSLETFSSLSDLLLKYPEVITDNPNSYYYLDKVVAVSIGGSLFYVQCQYNGSRLEWDTISTTVSNFDGTTFSFATSAFSLNQYDTNVRCVAFPFSAGVRPNGDKLTPPAFMISGFGAGISEFILSVRIITDEILDIDHIDHTNGTELTHDIYFNKYIVTRDTTNYNDILQVTDCARTIDVSKKIKIFDAPQLVTNGDFSNGTTGWSTQATASFTVVSGVGQFVSNSQYGEIRKTLTTQPVAKYYACVDIKATTNAIRLNIRKSSTYIGEVTVFYSGSNTFEKLSGILNLDTSVDLQIRVQDYRTSAWDTVYVDNVCAFNISTLIANKQYSPLYNTTFDLMSDAEIKAQMDLWVTDENSRYVSCYDDINLLPDGTSYYYPFKKHMLYLYGKEILVDANKLSHLFLDIIITVKGTAFSLYYKDKRNVIADGLMTSEIIWQADRLDMFYQNNPTYKDQFIVDGIAKGAIATGSVLLGAFSTVTNPGFIANGVGSAINLTSSIINYGLMEKGKRAEPDQRNGDSSNIDLAILKGYGIYWVTMTPEQEILDILKSQYSLVGFPTNVYKTINETTPFDVFNIWKKAMLLNGEVKEIIENVQITREINTKLGQGVIVEYE